MLSVLKYTSDLGYHRLLCLELSSVTLVVVLLNIPIVGAVVRLKQSVAGAELALAEGAVTDDGVL